MSYEKRFDPSEYTGRRLFVGNLPKDEDAGALKQMLIEFFEPYGKIFDVHLPRDWNTSGLRGFAFITFEDPTAAEAALSSTDRTEFDGRTISVQMALPGFKKFKE